MNTIYASKYGPVTISDSEYFVNDEIMFCKKVEINVDGDIFSYKISDDRIMIGSNTFMIRDIFHGMFVGGMGDLSKSMSLIIIDPLVEGVDIDIEFIKKRLVEIINIFMSVEKCTLKDNNIDLNIDGENLYIRILENTVVLEYNSKRCTVLISYNEHQEKLQGILVLMHLYFPNVVNIIMNNDEIDLMEDAEAKFVKLIYDNKPTKPLKRAN